MIQAYFIMTAAQKAAGNALNNTDQGILLGGRAIDAEAPGTGTNISGLAEGFAVDDPVPLVGMYVAPYRILSDPDYIHWVPEMITLLLTFPVAVLDSEIVFAPDQDL